MNCKQKLKRALLTRYGESCVYCKTCLSQESMTVDHVVPKCKQKGVANNLRPACTACNRAKGDMSVKEFRRHIIKLFFRILNPFWKRNVETIC